NKQNDGATRFKAPTQRLRRLDATNKSEKDKQRVGERRNEREQERLRADNQLGEGVRKRIREIEGIDREMPTGQKNIAVCNRVADDKPLHAVGRLRKTRRDIQGSEERNNRNGKHRCCRRCRITSCAL